MTFEELTPKILKLFSFSLFHNPNVLYLVNQIRIS
jgi:hypothetical protein